MRSDSDDWDITTSVGSTALFVAAARTLAAQDDEPLAVDPLAELFLRAAGGEWALLADLDPELTRDHILRSPDFGTSFRAHIAGRTRYFDEYLLSAREAGIAQVVILAAGLDARAYRLPCLAGAVVYELDRSHVLDFKRETLAEAGVEPLADRREVAVDLREEWLDALRDNGFDPAAPTAWLVEGLLIYITPEAQDQLFTTLDAASAAGSRAAIEQMTPLPREEYTEMVESEQADDEAKSDWARLIYNDPRSDAAQWFSERGWDAERTGLADYLRAAGRPLPVVEAGTGNVGATLINLVTVIRR